MFKGLEFMQIALTEAKLAFEEGEWPVGCVLVRDDVVIAQGRNMIEKWNDPMAHAEIIVVQKAHKIQKQKYLDDCSLFVTLEPCSMCKAVLKTYRIGRIVYGASNLENEQVLCHEIGGVCEAEAKELLDLFAKGLR